MIIAIGAVLHETNTFSPVRTDINAFKRKEFLVGDSIRQMHTGKLDELGGFIHELSGNAKIHPTVSAIAMPSGLVLRKTYEKILGTLINQLHNCSCEALLLALHGSMCVEDIEDPEGNILNQLKNTFPNLIIGITLDHHANVTETMAYKSDFLIGYRTHPHVDQFDVGREAARILLNKSFVKCNKQFIKLPLITQAENRPEAIEKLKSYTEKLCQQSQVITASYFVGYPWADVSIMGASVYVLATSGAYIKEFARFMWSLRDQFGYAIHILKDIDMDIRSQHTRPIVLNELSDCTFGGAAGDVMTTATYLVTHHIPKAAVVGIVDPGSVEQAFKVGVGVKEKFTIGGKICMKNNPSLKISAEVVSLHTNVCPKSHMEMESGMVFNRVAIISAEGVHLLLIEYPGPIGGPAFFDAVGLSATDYQVIVVKEGLNPFVTYNNVCEKILMVESPGFNPQRLTPDLFHHLNKKLYPIYSDVLDINL